MSMHDQHARQVATAAPQSIGRGQGAAGHSRRRILAVLGAVAVSLPTALFTMIPTIQAKVQVAMQNVAQQRFGLFLLEPTTITTTSSPVPAALTATIPQPVDVAEAQRRAPFLRLPTWLPPGMVARNATVFPAAQASGSTPAIPAQVQVNFCAKACLQLTATEGQAVAGWGVDASRAQDWLINSHRAVYAKGGWRGGAWDETLTQQYLSWQVGGVTYVLMDSGVGLGSEDLQHVAQSIP